MRLQNAVVILVILLAAVMGSSDYAAGTEQESPPSHEETARTLFELLRMRELSARFWREAILELELSPMEGSEEGKRALQVCGPQEIVDAAIPVFMRHFSQEELQELIVTLQTEEGKLFAKLLGIYAEKGTPEELADQLNDDELNALMRLFERPVVVMFLERLPESIAEMRETGHRLGKICRDRAEAARSNAP